jgi:hypothetical protein
MQIMQVPHGAGTQLLCSVRVISSPSPLYIGIGRLRTGDGSRGW